MIHGMSEFAGEVAKNAALAERINIQKQLIEKEKESLIVNRESMSDEMFEARFLSLELQQQQIAVVTDFGHLLYAAPCVAHPGFHAANPGSGHVDRQECASHVIFSTAHLVRRDRRNPEFSVVHMHCGLIIGLLLLSTVHPCSLYSQSSTHARKGRRLVLKLCRSC